MSTTAIAPAIVGGGFALGGVVVGAVSASWVQYKNRKEARRARQVDALVVLLDAADVFVKVTQANYMFDGEGSDQLLESLQTGAADLVLSAFQTLSVADTRVLVTVPRGEIRAAAHRLTTYGEEVVDSVSRFEVARESLPGWRRRVDGLPLTQAPLKSLESLQGAITSLTDLVGSEYASA